MTICAQSAHLVMRRSILFLLLFVVYCNVSIPDHACSRFHYSPYRYLRDKFIVTASISNDINFLLVSLLGGVLVSLLWTFFILICRSVISAPLHFNLSFCVPNITLPSLQNHEYCYTHAMVAINIFLALECIDYWIHSLLFLNPNFYLQSNNFRFLRFFPKSIGILSLSFTIFHAAVGSPSHILCLISLQISCNSFKKMIFFGSLFS